MDFLRGKLWRQVIKYVKVENCPVENLYGYAKRLGQLDARLGMLFSYILHGKLGLLSRQPSQGDRRLGDLSSSQSLLHQRYNLLLYSQLSLQQGFCLRGGIKVQEGRANTASHPPYRGGNVELRRFGVMYGLSNTIPTFPGGL